MTMPLKKKNPTEEGKKEEDHVSFSESFLQNHSFGKQGYTNIQQQQQKKGCVINQQSNRNIINKNLPVP
ncbi:MAG: hypothetical protein ACI90V_005722 [Bacillariaceae sp.]|jgi:hypothetical protein